MHWSGRCWQSITCTWFRTFVVENGFSLQLSMWLRLSLIIFWQWINKQSWMVLVFGLGIEKVLAVYIPHPLFYFIPRVDSGCRERGVAGHTQQHHVRPSPDGPPGSGPWVRRVWHHVSCGGGSVCSCLQGDHRPQDQRGCARVRKKRSGCKQKRWLQLCHSKFVQQSAQFMHSCILTFTLPSLITFHLSASQICTNFAVINVTSTAPMVQLY